MDKRIQDILNDLYRIDPQLRAQERELRKLVSQLVVAKPDTHFNPGFASQLREELLSTKVRPMPVASPYSSFFVSRVFYGILGSALTILIVVPFTFVATQKATSPEKPIVLNPFSPQVKDVTSGLSPKQQISNKGINAFGTLALVPTEESAPESGASQKGASTLMSPTATVRPDGKGLASSTSGHDITYDYKGEKVSLRDEQAKVYKRTKGIDSGKQLAGIIQNSKFGLTNLTDFGDLTLKDITLASDETDGYMVNVNFTEGAITINPNWPYWDKTNVDRVAALDRDTLLSLANDFVKSHGIDTSVYGTPVIQDTNSVVYPLMIDGKEVYEGNGKPFGLVVTIDGNRKKVSEVTNLMSQTYDSSLYNLETNFDTIVNVATSSLGAPGGVKTAHLSTPQQVLMHYWLFDDKTGTNNELFIPALRFGVSDSQPGMSSSIVIPLVRDFLGKQSHVGISTESVSTVRPQ